MRWFSSLPHVLRAYGLRAVVAPLSQSAFCSIQLFNLGFERILSMMIKSS